jgi:Ribonuclease G/E
MPSRDFRSIASERLDLDHVRALVREHHRGDRARDHAGEIEHPHAVERTRWH